MDNKTLEYIKGEINRLDDLIRPRLVPASGTAAPDADLLDAYITEKLSEFDYYAMLLTVRSWCYRVGLDHKGRVRTEIPGCNPVAVGLVESYWHPIVEVPTEDEQ